MKVSIAMATFNGSRYLYEQLESIRTQTMKVDEVIICDDRSNDNTVDMLQEYIKKNNLENSWKVYVNDKNMGYADNFHKALQLARGDFIFFCDQDDVWCKDKVEKVVKVMQENENIKLLCTDYSPLVSSENAPSISNRVMKKMKMDGSLDKIQLNPQNIYIASLGCDMCIRKSFRDQIEPFWIDGWAHDDYVWKTSQCVDGCYIYHEALLQRRLHADNVSMKKMHEHESRVKFLKELAKANTGMLQFAKSVNLKQSKIHFIERTIKAITMRVEIVEKRKLTNCIRLLMYIDCYQSKKSFLMEPYIALKSKKA